MTLNILRMVVPSPKDEEDDMSGLLHMQHEWFGVIISTHDLWKKYRKKDWLDLLNVPATELEFHDEYGSHIDHQTNTLKNIGDRICFEIDGANGMTMSLSIPVAECRDAIEEIAAVAGLYHSR